VLSIILGLITGLAGPIAQVATNITDLKRAKISADSDVDKARINAQIEDLHDKRSVLVAEAGNRLNTIVRSICALFILTYPIKIFFYDKVLGAFMGCAGHATELRPGCSTFNTDALLDPNLVWILVSVIGFYFLSSWRK